jgi:hypothetical protein
MGSHVIRDAALERLITVPESARQRKAMYFQPVAPVAVIHWLNGLRVGFAFAGLEWSQEYRRLAVERRGLKFRAAAWETQELQERGLCPEAVADELLAIEIEMWQSLRGDGAGR